MTMIPMESLAHPPQDWLEWARFASAMIGLYAFGMLLYRLFSRADLTTPLMKTCVTLLAAFPLVVGAAAARAEQLDAPFNELALVGLLLNAVTAIVATIWHHWPGAMKQADVHRQKP